jgi:hypothetical protein
MPDHQPRSSYGPDELHYTKATARSAVRTAIGQKLRGRYEVPQDLPREMLTLLTRVNAPQNFPCICLKLPTGSSGPNGVRQLMRPHEQSVLDRRRRQPVFG